MNDKKDSFSDKLNHLFEKVRKDDGSQYTQAEVVEGTGGVLTRVYLWKLRTGRASNPGFQIIQAISAFFNVDPSYFFEGDDGKSPDREKTQPRNKYIEEIAQRSSMLDDEGKKAVLNMIDYILKTQKGVQDESKEA